MAKQASHISVKKITLAQSMDEWKEEEKIYVSVLFQELEPLQ